MPVAFGTYFRTYFMDKDLDDNACDNLESDQKPTVTECIEEFIHREVGCNIPWHMSKNVRKQECASDNQFGIYQQLAFDLATMDSKEMAQKTGCKKRCKRMEYKLWETSPIGSKTDYPPEIVKLSFIFSTGKISSYQ